MAPVDSSMKDKICLITGANSGIGFATTLGLAQRGANVIMLCRDPQKATEAAHEVTRQTGHKPHIIIADLAHPKQIQKAVCQFSDQWSRLDVLVNNAGAYFPTHVKTSQGLEMTFAVNHMGPFLLTKLLRPILDSTTGARIVNVSSRAHRQGRINFDDLNRDNRRYWGYLAYADSKLCNILFTRGLCQRLPPNVTANCLHPGVIRTGFGQDSPGLFNRLFQFGAPLLSSPDQGAQTSLFLACDKSVASTTGLYFVRCRPKQAASRARNHETMQRLWDVSETLSAAALS